MQLLELTLEHQDCFLRMTADYKANDFVTYDRWFKKVSTPVEFAVFFKKCQTERMDWRPKAGKVSQTRYVLLADDGEICGNGVLRFPLNEKIEQDGGNLVFDVPPSRRGQGYGALTLNRMLFEAVRAGMARALVTCDLGNAAARRSIEKNRGELAESDEDLARYWIRFR